MTIDYRGLRLIEQVLNAEERCEEGPWANDSYEEYSILELKRLNRLLWEWVADKFNYTVGDGEDAPQKKVNELLDAFRAQQ